MQDIILREVYYKEAKQLTLMGANYLEGTIKTIWIEPMAQSEDGQVKL